jgi:hypothetical protein
MFPNPQDALPLPRQPNLEQYKKLAKELIKACKSGEPDAIRDWASRWVGALVKSAGLTMTPGLPAQTDRWADLAGGFAKRKLESASDGEAKCALGHAQFIIARSHGFESWPKFAKHVEGLATAKSPVSKFEAAADAIVAGDDAELRRLLREDPVLIRSRSTREHRATLLHYVSANGVEGYRQKTPKNAVQIAETLLKAGAEVDAEADVYGGAATTLGLTATSIHPEKSGVQNELMQLLLNHGASMDRLGVAGNRLSAVMGCLANGRGKAAEFLAARGARLDLETGAGAGRLDVVKSFFNQDGTLKTCATKIQLQRGFLWACEFGRNGVLAFLLERGADLQDQAGTGQTGLHWAVVGGQLSTIKLLLDRGAPLEEINEHGGTVLGQAGWLFINGNPVTDYVPIFEVLLAAGAKIEDGWLAWLEKQEGRPAAAKELLGELLRRYGAKS